LVVSNRMMVRVMVMRVTPLKTAAAPMTA